MFRRNRLFVSSKMTANSSPQAAKVLASLLIIVTCTSIYTSAIPTNEKKQRVHDKQLSDEQHEVNGEHNNDYDHEAFLGHDEAETFDQLSPEESKARLAIIVDKIDSNKDNTITEEELKKWIQYVQRRYITTDTERMWKDHEPEADGSLLWESYQKRTFGYSDEPVEGSPTFEYKDMIDRDMRRWKRADKDADGKMTKEEFKDFLHPEEAEHMRDIVVEETLEDIDKDKDGFISLQEYIDDIWGEDDDDDDDDDDDEEDEHDKSKDGEPEWVQSEREQFSSFRDKNNDGKLDKQEIKDWIIPDDYDHSSAEANHLLRSSDEDKDGVLSKDEILEKYDLFVGSQATDFGEALTKHDEF